MGDVARMSLTNEALLYRLFGVNAELLIDHAWGWEPCTMDQIKAYRPETNSLSSSQVLTEPYTFAKARIVVREMAIAVALDLVDKHLVADQLTLTINYDTENLKNDKIRKNYKGEIVRDWYGREVPHYAHGTARLSRMTSSRRIITKAVLDIFDRTVNPDLLIRRITIGTYNVVDEQKQRQTGVQQNLFSNTEEALNEEAQLRREQRMQKAALAIKKRFGKNAPLWGTDFEEGATARQRNRQIGGHHE